MIGIKHFIVAILGCTGFLCGAFLVDLDHKGTLDQKWNAFWHKTDKDSTMGRGIFHNRFFAFGLIAFLQCFVVGYLIHICMDFLKHMPE